MGEADLVRPALYAVLNVRSLSRRITFPVFLSIIHTLYLLVYLPSQYGSTFNSLFGALSGVVSASGIVFANKAVMTNFGFHFIYALTLIHTLFTLIGMQIFCCAGMFEKKVLSKKAVAPLAGAYVGYIVLNNLNLQINTVGFYQISKIAVAPAVLAAEAVFFGKRASRRVVASIVLVCIGVGLSTVTDTHMGHNLSGWLVGGGAIAATAAYQIWAGTKQKELGVGSMALLEQYSPLAAVLLGVMVPLFEPLGIRQPTKDTLLGYEYTWAAIVAIVVSAILGLLVSLSTFLVIGATSSLTYNVVGHVKTVIILMGGCLFFGDEMPLKKLAGISVAMFGIVWYSQLKLAAVAASARATAQARSLPSEKSGQEAALEPLLSSHSSGLQAKRRQNEPAPKAMDVEEGRRSPSPFAPRT